MLLCGGIEGDENALSDLEPHVYGETGEEEHVSG